MGRVRVVLLAKCLSYSLLHKGFVIINTFPGHDWFLSISWNVTRISLSLARTLTLGVLYHPSYIRNTMPLFINPLTDHGKH